MTDCALLPSACDSTFHDEPDPSDNLSTAANPVQTDYPPVESESAAGTVESNGEYNLEVPLRRSKRGKGRGTHSGAAASGGSTTGTNNSNGGISSDERVASCMVSGIEYRTGDFVYYEEPDFEYFTIGLIEEIKFSRRDKFTITMKCFYRTHDIPESSKQCILERELFHSPSNSRRKTEVLSRELFISEVQETIASKQLRGRCKVNHLQDLRTALNTFSPDEEDNFFYVFAYNPETRRLMHTRAEIRVGQAFQAIVPRFRHLPPATYHARIRRFRCGRRCRLPHHSHGQYCRSSRVPQVTVAGLGIDSKPELTERVPSSTTFPDSEATVDESSACLSKMPPQAMDERHKPEDPDMETDVQKSPPALENCSSAQPGEDSPSPRYRTSQRHTGSESVVKKLRPRKRRSRRWETLTWKPDGLAKMLSGAKHLNAPEVNQLFNGDIADEPLKTYLDAVRSMVAFFGFGGADDDLSSAENGLTLANLAATTQHAYDTLHNSGYSLKHALQSISYNPIASKDTPRHWTADQVRLFAYALRVHGKDFYAIQRDFFDGRTTTLSTTSSVQVGNSGVGNTASNGRMRGRGRRKAGISVVSSNSIKLKTDEEEAMADNKSEDQQQAAGEEADQGISNDSAGDNKPVKTVKELIAFYYYWKRKGAASATSPSMMITPNHQGGLTGAAVNFAAAVACANADGQSVLGNGIGLNGAVGQPASQQGPLQQLQQQPLAGGKRRKPTTTRGNAPRASTPASELSESAGASLPDSETEGIPDADEQSDYNVPAKDEQESQFDSNRSTGTEQDLPPSGRLRRRLCRNCAKELHSPTDALQPTGVGQLRFLCHPCRTHLQKYGELKSTSSASCPPPQLHSELSIAPSSPVDTPSEGKPVLGQTPTGNLTPCSMESPVTSPVPGSRRPWKSDTQPSSIYSSTHSPYQSSFCATVVDSEDYFSSSSSLESGCSFSHSESSSEAESQSIEKHSGDHTLRKNPKRARIQNKSESTAPDQLNTHPETADSKVMEHSQAIGVTGSLRVTKVSPQRTSANHTSCEEPRHSPGQVSINRSQPSTDLPRKPQFSIHSHDKRVSSPQSNTTDAPSSSVHQEVGDLEDGDTDSETEVELTACTSSLTPCLRQVHRSTWSRLVRIWDRSVTLRVPTDPNRTIFNTGSCARTDVIYEGRGQTEEEVTQARRELYSRHAETAIGPGAAGVDIKTDVPESSKPQTCPSESHGSMSGVYSTSHSSGYSTTVLNLSARSLHSSPTPRLAPPLSRGSNADATASAFFGQQHPSTQSTLVSSFKNPTTHPANARTSTTPSQLPGSGISPASYDPSPTQQQIQAAYEQAMLLAAAATQHHYQQARLSGQQSREAQQSHRQLSTPNASHSPRTAVTCMSSSNAKVSAAQLSARLGAAAGTFYPPALVTSAPNLASPTGGRGGQTSQLPAHSFPSCFLPPAVLSSLGAGGTVPSMSHASGYPPFVNPVNSTASSPGEALWKNHDVLQRQLAMLGLIPPTTLSDPTNLYGAMDPREADAFRLLMADKLNQLRYHSGNPSANEQQQDFLAAATEMLLRARTSAGSGSFGDSSNGQTNQPIYPPPPISNPGAMTSAVNSISTRPTASVQSPHYRYSSGSTSHASTYSRRPSSQDPHAQLSLSSFHSSPPLAHLGLNSSAPRVPSMNLSQSTSYLPQGLAASTSNIQSRMPNSASLANISPSTAPSNRQNSSFLAAQQLQEQMFNAAKLAMLAANMQSDPSKAFTFAAALAELAAHEKSQSHPAALGSHSSKSSGLSISPFDMRAHSSGGSGITNNISGSHPDRLGAASPFLGGDRRRSSIPFGGIGSGALSPSLVPSQTGGGLSSSRPPGTASVSQSRMMSSPAISTSSNRFSTAPFSVPHLTPNFAGAFNPGHIPSPTQLAQLSQLAHSAGIPPGLGLQDPAMLNALALAAAAAYAAGPQPSEFPSVGDSDSGERHRYSAQMASSASRHASLQQQQQQAAAAAFAALPQFNLGGHRLPSSHR